MKKIKISTLWIGNFRESLIFKLIEDITNKKIEIVSIENSDILIFGPYDPHYIKRKFFNLIKKKFYFLNNVFPNLDLYLLNRKIKPLRIFYSHEAYPLPDIYYDYSITTHLGISNGTRLRFPLWKDLIDWSHLGIKRELNQFMKRFDNFYNIKELMSPQGDLFMGKKREICLFTSHLNEPRKSMYLSLLKNFKVDGYGPYFNNKIKDHNSSSFSKKEVLKQYAFNLCPENVLCPGFYTEKVPEAFLGKSLPITWSDNNISLDFNEKSFINLLNYSKNNYLEINSLLKDDSFLKKFTTEPLLLKEPDLTEEIKFLKKIFA
jgi:hypothetical protein